MPQATLAAEPRTAVAPAGHYRWVIVALLFVVTTINYMDRNLLGVLKPTIQGDLHFSESEFGQIVFAFSISYAVFCLKKKKKKRTQIMRPKKTRTSLVT